MSNSVQVIDELLTKFGKEIIIKCNDNELKNKSNIKSIGMTNNNKINKINTTNNKSKTCNKHKNGMHITRKKKNKKNNNNSKTTSDKRNNKQNNQSAKPVTPPPPQPQIKEEIKEETKQQNVDELSEEEALRLAMEMSMNEDDKKLVSDIEKEIQEAQGHLSNWFAGNFKSIKDKNRAWFSFSRRLHHKFEMYRIEQGIIQPLSYQFFIQFIALMYGTMKNNTNQTHEHKNNDDALYIDQHKIKNIQILSADDDAIKYLRFANGLTRCDLKDAVYAKFESLALDPMAPNQWKFNHVMFLRSEKAPNGLLWTKWHMQ